MADTKISGLTAAAAAAGTNELPINEVGTTKKLTVAQVATYVNTSYFISINFVIDGGGSVITTGLKGSIYVDFPCVVETWKMIADEVGSITIDVWSGVYTDLPTDANTMPGIGNEPKIVNAQWAYGYAVPGVWTKTTLAPNDVLRFNVDSCTGIKRVTLDLKVRRTA